MSTQLSQQPAEKYAESVGKRLKYVFEKAINFDLFKCKVRKRKKKNKKGDCYYVTIPDYIVKFLEIKKGDMMEIAVRKSPNKWYYLTRPKK